MTIRVSRGLVAGALAGLVFMAGATSATAQPPSLSLGYTVSASDLNPLTCATEHVISVQPGDQVKFCYEVTNTGGTTFNFHDLFDSGPGAGQLLSNSPFVLAPGNSTFRTRLATIGASQINTATWEARDVLPGYGFLTSNDVGGPVFAFEDISATGTALNLTDDSEAAVTIPFAVQLYGVSSSNVVVGNNGGIVFNATTAEVGFTNAALPSAETPPLRIYPFWDDLDEENGNVFHETRGTAPNRRFIVQWHNRPHFNGETNPTNTVTFQLILTEGSPNILFQYLDIVFGVAANPEWDNGGSATVGLNQTATSANQFSFNTASLANNFAIRWSPSAPPQEASDSDLAAVRVRAPDMILGDTEIDGTVFVGQTSTDTLTIGNAGDDPLAWNLTEAPADENAHIPNAARVSWPQAASGEPASMQAHEVSRSHVSEGKSEQVTAPDRRAGVVMLPLGSGAPAFAAKIFPAPNQFVSFNTSTPGTTTPLGGTLAQSFFAGAFVGNDFSKLYALDGGSASPTLNQLFTINTTTGATTFVANSAPQAGDTWTGMAFDPTTGTMYASAAGGTPISSRLYTLNTNTGTPVLVGQIGEGIIIDIAINAAGQVFGVSISPPDSLVAINKSTAAGTVVGALGVDANFAQGMAFDKAADVLYWAAYRSTPGGELYTINTVTGAATLVGGLAANGEYDAFDIATAAGPCSEPEDIPWLDVSPTSGTVLPGEPESEVALTYDASALAVGTYSANLCLNSNDPEQAFVQIPVELTVEPLPDIIFQNGFDSTGGTPGIYTDRATFLQNTQPGFFENPFANAVDGPSPPLSYTSGGFAYTVSASTGQLFNAPGIISTDLAADTIVVTFTGAPVTAIGGNFWATDISVVPTGTTITLTLSDATVETFTTTGPTSFRGFVTLVPITSITIDAPDTPVTAWSTMDNLITGVR